MFIPLTLTLSMNDVDMLHNHGKLHSCKLTILPLHYFNLSDIDMTCVV
jgi:hypothetical protein